MRSGVLWALAAGLLAFTWITGLSIGVFVLPGALVALVVALRDPREWQASGFGVAAVLCFVAWVQRGPEGLDARPWLGAGVLFGCAALAATLARRGGDQP